MILERLMWAPVLCTAILMYIARVTHLAVLHYNVFLILLLVWVSAVIAFFRLFAGARRGSGRR